MSDRLTPFGARCRHLRIRYRLVMADQAKGIGLSVAYISAIERGKRPVPDDYPDKLSHWLSLAPHEAAALAKLASSQKKLVKIRPEDEEHATLANEFANSLSALSAESVRRVREILASSKSTKYSDNEICSRAALARKVFEIGDQISFDILRIVENKLAEIDPNFMLQVDEDGSGEYLQIYSSSDGKAVNRIVLSEWHYDQLDRGIANTRFALAHELAHWFLHRKSSHAFFRVGSGKIASKYPIIEQEADFFARVFLIPSSVVRRFQLPESLARATNVPIRVARQRIADFSRLNEIERNEIEKEGFTDAVDSSVKRQTVHLAAAPEKEKPQSASSRVLLFTGQNPFHPNTKRKKTKNVSSSQQLLLDFTDQKVGIFVNLPNHRADKWFRNWGWRE